MRNAFSRYIRGLAKAVAIGAAGGAASGFLIGVLGGGAALLLTADDVALAANAAGAFLGMCVGAVVGACVVPLAYVLLLYRTGFRIAVVPAAIGTVGGGVLSYVIDPEQVFAFGIGGFAAAMAFTWFLDRRRSGTPMGDTK
jgi:hypothetical protein